MRFRFCIILLALVAVVTGDLYAREVINLNNGWRFSREASLDRNMVTVNLPHAWNSNDRGATYFGTGSYLKELVIPQSWAHEKRVYLRVGAASNTATLLVNGRYVGEHKGGFTSFTFDITPYLNFGVYNSILFMVNNSPQPDMIPLSVDRNFYGGLYRGCELIVTDVNHIAFTDNGGDGMKVVAESVDSQSALISAEVSIEGFMNTNVDVSLEIKDPAEAIVVHRIDSTVTIGYDGSALFTTRFKMNYPRLWNGLKDPFMYQVTVKTKASDGSLDSLSSNLGIRSVGVDRENGFLLNGAPYKLRGVILNQDRSGVGSALSYRDMEEDIHIILEMGANAVRLADGPHNEYIYSLCDKYGLIVWSDLPLRSGENQGGKGFIDSYMLKDNVLKQMDEMLEQLEEHPSIAMWGIFSNLRSGGDDPKVFLGQLSEYAKEVTPNILTVSTSIEDGKINYITDMVSWAQYFGWTSGSAEDFLRWAEQFKSGWTDLMPGVGEYGASGDITVQCDNVENINSLSEKKPEKFQALFHEKYADMMELTPYFWGTFINSMFDYGRAVSVAGESSVGKMGLVSFDRHTRKDAFYVYKALWSNEPFVHIADRRNDNVTGYARTIKVYSNRENVELIVNDVSLGNKRTERGRASWDVTLKPGLNTIEAISGTLLDEITINAGSDILTGTERDVAKKK